MKTAIFEAVEKLLSESADEMPSMAAIAGSAGVNPTSLYRRWGDVNTLVAEVAIERLLRDLPVPDTGSLRGDLIGWAGAVERNHGNRKNAALLRIMTATAKVSRVTQKVRALPIARRLEELEAMLARARKRKEYAPELWDVLEIVLAPIYLRILYLGPINDPNYAAKLVDRALSKKSR